MNCFCKYLAALLATLCFTCGVHSQSITVGNDFWVMFLVNGGDQRPQTLTITAIGDTSCSVTISNPLTNWSSTVNLAAGGQTSVTLPEEAIPTTYAQAANNAFHITSTAGITVQASFTQVASSGVATLISTPFLRNQYVVLDYPADPSRADITGASLGLVAVEDNTTITLTLPCPIIGSTLGTGDELSITLDEGQSYLLCSNTANATFSGTTISANKPFAIFQGNQITGVPYTGSSGDYMYEQAIPPDYWGTDYALVTTKGRTVGDRVRVTAADDCTVTLSNGNSFNLNAGQCHEFAMAANSTLRLQSTQPISVGICMSSSTYGGEYGDASLMMPAPLSRAVSHANFSMISTDRIHTYYLNIIVRTEHLAGLTLDGTAPNMSQFSNLDTAYSYARLTLSEGVHHLDNSLGGFVAWAYGVGNVESYCFPLGIRGDTVEIGPQEPVTDTIDYFDTVCQGNTYNGYGFNVSPTETATAGTLDFWHTEGNADYILHIHLHLTVLANTAGVVYDTVVCGEPYLFNGVTYESAGVHLAILEAANGCDSVVTLRLAYRPDTVLCADTVCQGLAYSGYGFNLTAAEAGTRYLQRDTVEGGCPRTYLLTLTVLPTASSHHSASIVLGDTLTFNGMTITSAGDYTFTLTAANGCDSTVHLHVAYEEVGIRISADGICPGDSVTITATGTNYIAWTAAPPDPSLNQQQGQNPIVVSPLQTTVYSLVDANGNTVAQATVSVEPPPTLCVRLNRPFIDFDYPVMLFNDCSEGAAHSTWTFSDGVIINASTARRSFSNPMPDSVGVELTSCNSLGCCVDTAFTIYSKIRSIWFPNAFTPDQPDNNRFGPVSNLRAALFHLFVYNRLGLLVWSTDDINSSWDGTHDGTPCQQGCYAFHWWLTDSDGFRYEGTGTVTLLR